MKQFQLKIYMGRKGGGGGEMGGVSLLTVYI